MNSTTVTLNDFDIIYYPGLTSKDVIPKLIEKLQLTFSELPQDSIQYKAIQTYIRLLTTYMTISDISNNNTNHSIIFFNFLSQHLQEYAKQKYPQFDIYVEPKGRIKSVISANKKIKEKIFEYMKKGKDLDTLTIRDFIAFRFIIDVRDHFGNLIPESTSVDICYDIINEAIQFINNYKSAYLLPISSKPKVNENISNTIYHPPTRPAYIEANNDIIKDYIFSPKSETNYQSAHLQFLLIDTESDEELFGELQFRTFVMNEHAEHGAASHEIYKTRKQITYLAVPQILAPIKPFSSTVDFLLPDEAFKYFFGFPPTQIHPQLNYQLLKSFLEENNYTLPILPLNFKKSENGNIEFYEIFSKIRTKPLEIVGTTNNQQLQILVWDIFDEKNIEKDFELEFI